MSRRLPPAALVAAAAVVVALFAAAQPAQATLIVIPNSSFQNPDLVDNAFTDTLSNANAIPNWSFKPMTSAPAGSTISSGVWDPGSTDYTGAAGDNSPLPGTSIGGQVSYIYLEQGTVIQPIFGDLTSAEPVAVVESETSYTLTVALGRGIGVPTGDVTLALMISDFPIASVVVPASAITANTFKDFSVNLTTFEDYPFATSDLHARITHTYTAGGDASLDIDNVRLDVSPVPEPASATLAVLALGAVLPLRRRRR